MFEGELELELEAELEDLIANLSESELEAEIEGEIPQGQPQGGTALTCRPPIVLNGFRSGEYTLRPQHYAQLLAVPRAPIVVIRGHSDNQGSAVTNAGISLSRAFEVLQWLTSRNGGSPIASRRVIVEPVGPALPVASNANEAGRSMNRRVEIFLCSQPPPPPPIVNATRIEMNTRVA